MGHIQWIESGNSKILIYQFEVIGNAPVNRQHGMKTIGHQLAAWCQVPVVYQLKEDVDPFIHITWHDGAEQTLKELTLSVEQSAELFQRSNRIRQLTLVLGTGDLFSE